MYLIRDRGQSSVDSSDSKIGLLKIGQVIWPKRGRDSRLRDRARRHVPQLHKDRQINYVTGPISQLNSSRTEMNECTSANLRICGGRRGVSHSEIVPFPNVGRSYGLTRISSPNRLKLCNFSDPSSLNGRTSFDKADLGNPRGQWSARNWKWPRKFIL